MPIDRSRKVGKPGKSFAEWLSLSEREGDVCYPWQGRLNEHGYGTSHYKFGRKLEVYAHRIAWILAKGPIPEDKEIDHTCEHRDCVNPDHMELVTRKVNIERRVTHSGRGPGFTKPSKCGHPREYHSGGRLKPCSICRAAHVESWRANTPDWKQRRRSAQAKYDAKKRQPKELDQ